MAYSLLIRIDLDDDAEIEQRAEANYDETERAAQLRVSAHELATPGGLMAFWARWLRFWADAFEKMAGNGA